MMKRSVLLAALAFASIASAQRGPLPGMPIVPPPVSHPALLGQPLIQPDGNGKPAAPARARTKGAKTKPAKKRPQPPQVDPATRGAKASGRTLKKRIDKVTKELKWGKRMPDLQARSAATGKPILYLQALGSLTGFA